MGKILTLRVGIQLRLHNIWILAQAGRPAEATSKIKEMNRKYPRSARVWEMTSEILTKTGDLEGAEEAVKNAAKYGPPSGRSSVPAR